MAWCPKCRQEYVDGVEKCDDCGLDLVLELEPEVPQNLEEIDDEIEELDISKYQSDPLFIKSLLDTEEIVSSVRGNSISVFSVDYEKAEQFLEDYFNAEPLLDDPEQFQDSEDSENVETVETVETAETAETPEYSENAENAENFGYAGKRVNPVASEGTAVAYSNADNKKFGYAELDGADESSDPFKEENSSNGVFIWVLGLVFVVIVIAIIYKFVTNG